MTGESGKRVRRRRLVGLLVVLSCVASLVLLTPSPQATAGGTDTSGQCSGSGCSVSVNVSGTAVSTAYSGGTSVPPDCWFEPWGLTNEEAFVLRVVWEFFRSLFPFLLDLPWDEVGRFKEAATNPALADHRWYLIECRAGINAITSDEAMDAAGTTEWYGMQVAKMTALLGPGEAGPRSSVSVKTLLDVALAAFEVPDPEVQRSPEIDSQGGAALINTPTTFWSDSAVDTYSVTASAGPVSVTVTAQQDGYTLTSPAGSTTCTHEQFTTPWSATAPASSLCQIVFDQASEAGWPVDVTSSWTTSWTATGRQFPQPLDPLTSTSQTIVPVTESWAIVENTD